MAPYARRPPWPSTRAPRPSRPDDPVLVKRAKIAKWTLLANRVGYLFVALGLALFIIAFAVGFSAAMATLVLVSVFIGFALLLPSIILGWAVKAAAQDDRERGF